MVWRGVLIRESIEDDSLLMYIQIASEDANLLKIEVKDEDKDIFVESALKFLKQRFYVYIVKEGVMYVIFKNHMFKFSKGYPELDFAREHGRKLGIPYSKMRFEKLLDNPWNL